MSGSQTAKRGEKREARRRRRCVRDEENRERRREFVFEGKRVEKEPGGRGWTGVSSVSGRW